MSDWLWLIPILPLCGAALAAGLGSVLKGHSHWPVVIGSAAACVVAFIAFGQVYAHPELPLVSTQWSWFTAGDVNATFGLRVDTLTAVMLVTITFVGTLIAVFSVGYMHHDPGYARFFALIGLFLFSMCVLVLGDNLILLFAGWEGVGLCSYALIGYYYARPSAAAAARKAFLVTRLGDAALVVGIFLLWAGLGYRLDYVGLFDEDRLHTVDPTLLTTACLLLFCGCAGKSAQFPLHVWLADAMEGPTPVSALIHAATMVTAGVYLVARCTPLFVHAPAAQVTVAVIGTFTALLAALIALTQHDLKRVLAYSTVSQLGYMFLALGSGLADLAGAAVVAAVFHLFTHAFFKALLFLSSGSVMHAMGDVIDMRKFGGLRKVLPITHGCFLVGALALAAIPPLSGFWSKDLILEAAAEAASSPDAATIHPSLPSVYWLLFGTAVLTAALTAFYTFRAYFRTFWGAERIPEEAHGHAHEAPPVMWVPLAILAVGAALVGLAFGPTGLFASFLAHTAGLAPHDPAAHGEAAPHVHALSPLLLTALSLGAGLLGIAGAYGLYGRANLPAEPAVGVGRMLYELSANRFYIDELYGKLIVAPLGGLAKLSAAVVDRLIDGLAMLAARLPGFVAAGLRPIQNGLVQFYALAMLMGLVAFFGFVLLRGFK